MMPISRRQLDIFLDGPESRDYVVSAFADLRVKDGFRHFVETHQKNQARAASQALSEAEARKALDANLKAIMKAVQEVDPAARGLAVFSGAERGLLHSVPLDFPVENNLVIDEDPFALPLMERWYTDPSYLVAVVNANFLRLFEAHSGVAEGVSRIERDVPEMQRDKPRFNYKKRFSKAYDERLQSLDNDPFLKDVAAIIAEHYTAGGFTGLLLLGPTEMTAAVRRLLPEKHKRIVVEEHPQTMTIEADDVVDDVERAMTRWREERERGFLHELQNRWKEKHLVANGATEVLDALQQGRADAVIVGSRRDLGGAACRDCSYRFGAPVAKCVYCDGETRMINALQEILRLALKNRVDVHFFPTDLKDDPIAPAGGVCALLRAEANWAPDKQTAEASRGATA